MNVNSSRHINTSLLLTVLSACLGLLIVGVPVQALAQSAREDVRCSDEAPAKIEQLLNSKVFINPLAGFVADLGKLISIEKDDLIGSGRERDESVKVFYQNSQALVRNNAVLIVTRLPRAGLSNLPAKQSASF